MRFLVIGFVLFVPFSICESENLYDVLGVRKTASQREIRQAYKKLARELHPDKTDDPDATSKFTRINEAYETIGDPEKRRDYDDFGYTSANARQPQQRQQHPFQGFNGFDNFFAGSNFNFNFGGGGKVESIIDKNMITMRQYESSILPNSNRKPCLIYVFTDFCFNCMRIESIIEKFIQELKSVGICAATVHAGHAGSLASTLRITQVPTVLGVINQRVSYFRGAVNSQNLKEFTRGLFPNRLFASLSDSNLHDFLDGWIDNRVRAIIFRPKEDIPVRFLATAFYYKDNIAFGFVYTRKSDVSGMLAKFNVNRHRETMLMFNEDSNMPVATISMQQLARSSLDEVIEGNKYLMLPRLSSQKFFDELCPEVYKVKSRKLCVVLMTKKGDIHDRPRDQFRKYSQRSSLSGNNRVQFTYLYEDTQEEFVKALSKGRQSQLNESVLKVAILWRVEKHQLKYEWLETGWKVEEEKLCGNTLESRLNVLLTTDTAMLYKTTPPTLYNEHGLGLLTRIGYKLLHWADRIWSYLSMFDSTAWITMGLSLTFIFGMGYFMHKLASLEEIQVQTSRPPTTHPRPPSRTFDEKCVKLYELDYRSYQELVSEADTGLTIALLVDKECKDKLVKQFAKIVHPYSRYSALTFAYVQLEYNLEWYRSLLQESVDDFNLRSINIRNCVGTVLALNGFRKYYYIYSAKRARKFIRDRNKVSEALGLHDLDEVSDEDNEGVDDYFFVDELLEGLSIWMDKIFDGSIKRVRITKWPEMTQ